jgi:hypothetical protein
MRRLEDEEVEARRFSDQELRGATVQLGERMGDRDVRQLLAHGRIARHQRARGDVLAGEGGRQRTDDVGEAARS